jgi:two-component system, NtrC family, response regulator HydG
MLKTPPPFEALVIDDDQASGESLSESLKRQNMRVTYFHHPIKGVSHTKTKLYDLAFIDLRMPEMDGLTVLKNLKQIQPDLLCIMMSGFATIDIAVEAMKDGAYDFLLKPIRRNFLAHVLTKTLDKLSLSKEIAQLRSQLDQGQSELIGGSPSMIDLRQLIKRVAKSPASVLILGESGTGKEIAVDLIHKFSDRHTQPLVKINCAAIPANLVEAELFGFVKGAFTGATHDKQGRFEQADGGTLFLDEIGELPHATQVKILRVLQDQTISRIGATDEKVVDVRIVSATNQDLQQLIKKGLFREDLYYRLNVVPIHIPPLRERSEDILILMRHFVDQACQTYKKPERWFTRKAIGILLQHHWPGNVRELKHLCEQLVITQTGKWISEAQLPKSYHQSDLQNSGYLQIPLGVDLESVISQVIRETLSSCGGNLDKAAKILGVHPRTLRRKLTTENRF